MDPLETEITKYQQRKNQLCEMLMDKETELAEFIQLLRAFESKFLQHLAPFHQQIHRWEQRCQITEAIIQKLEGMEWKNQTPPSSPHQWLESMKIAATKEPLETIAHPITKELNQEEQVEAKGIYKKLARRFHPDLVVGEEIQMRRQEVMSEINEAYRAGNLSALRELEYHPDIRMQSEESAGETWERLVREIALLEKKIDDCICSYQQAKESELGILLLRSHESQDPYQELEALLVKKIKRLQEKWIRLRHKEEKSWIDLDGQ